MDGSGVSQIFGPSLYIESGVSSLFLFPKIPLSLSAPVFAQTLFSGFLGQEDCRLYWHFSFSVVSDFNQLRLKFINR